MPVLATKFLTLAGGKKLAMATGLEYDDRVKYACSCSTFSPLVYQYFCKYCVKIRCPDCVTTSVKLWCVLFRIYHINRWIHFIVLTVLIQYHLLRQRHEREGEVLEKY